MVRSSYTQEAGNPLQRDLLPRHSLAFEFPLIGETYAANSKSRNQTLLLILMLDLVYSIIVYPVGWGFAAEFPLLMGLILAIMCGGHSKGAASTYLLILAGALSAAILMWFSGKSPLIYLPILAGMLSRYIYQFGTHWIYRCTLSPLPRAEAAAIRDQLNSPLLVLSAAPLGAAIAAIAFGSLFAFSGTLLLATLVQFCFTSNRWQALRYAKAALTSWCSYNLAGISRPGLFRSPVGSVQYRRVFLLTSALCFACLYGYAAPTLQQGVINLFAMLFLPATFFALTPLGLLLPLLNDVVRVRHSIANTNHWNNVVEECRNSTNPIARDSFYMGQVASDGTPLIVHRKTFEEHAHFLGTSGGGKTSKGVCPWIEQTIRHGDSSLIVIDLKADSLELLATLAAGAEELKNRTGKQLPLKVFTSNAELPTHAFNPLANPLWHNLTLNEKTDMICAALGLNYGTDYGAGYFSAANAAIVYEALRLFPTLRNFQELADRCRYLIQRTTKSELLPEIKKAGVHVCEELKRVGDLEQLQVSPNPNGKDPVAENAIDLASMFHEPQLLYVHLSSTLGASSAPMIGRLFTYFLLTSAAQTKRRCRVNLVIDEFQRMASKSLEYLLQLARSLDIGVILSNQSMEDLKTLKSSLIPAIEANCQYRQWFDVGSTEDLARVMQVSGERVEWLQSTSTSTNSRDTTESTSESQHIVPRLNINEINIAGSHKRQSIVRIGRDHGYAQYGRFPFVVSSDFHISAEEYQRRRAFAWPEKTVGMMIAKELQTPPSDKPSGPVISREVDGTEDTDTSTTPGPLNELFDSLDEPPKKSPKEEPKKGRKKKSDDDSHDSKGDDDEPTK